MVELTLPETSAFEPSAPAEDFYSQVICLMAESGIPFLLSGTYALACYTGITRPTKDVDVFTKAGDCLKMLNLFKERGFEIQVLDERWLARVSRGELFVDIIFNMPTGRTSIRQPGTVGEVMRTRISMASPSSASVRGMNP
jgi:hypothetical protein